MTFEPLKIIKADNGYIIEYVEFYEDETQKKVVEKHKITIQENFEDNTADDPELGEKKAIVRLLQEIKSYFGDSYDKWRRNNIIIGFENGYKLSETELDSKEKNDK